MKERPILFSAPMVRAILEGRKTQTRRVVKTHQNADSFVEVSGLWRPKGENLKADQMSRLVKCPFGQVGDELWVRESGYESGKWVRHYDQTDEIEMLWKPSGAWWYAADGSPPAIKGPNQVWRSRPSIHSPRKVSRIQLRITAVRVERLQDIVDNDSDAKAEGINIIHHGDGHYCYHHVRTEPHPENWVFADSAFKALWSSINGAASWDANPFVWVVEFERVKP